MSKFSALLLLILCPIAADAADDGYVAQIQHWRQDFDADVRSGGWLSLIGRIKVAEGATTIGSAPGNTVVLSSRAAAQHLGTLRRDGAAFQFEPARGVAATLDGRVFSMPAVLGTASGAGRVSIGALTLAVRGIGEDFYLMIRDANSSAIRDFKGTTWYPVDPAYRVPAMFTAYAKPEAVPVPMTHVDSREIFMSSGDVSFELQGHKLRLKSFIDDGELFVMFQDPTNGRDTYGGGRFLHAPLPRDGATMLDFNKAFNPYCSLNANVMCPVPLPGSRLDFAVVAGETFLGRH